MLFTETPKLRALERLMTTVPNFEPRASGFVIVHCFEPPPEVCPRGRLAYCGERTSCNVLRCPFLAKLIISGKARRADVLRETIRSIRSAAFTRRLNSLLRESEDDPMRFRNEKHRLAFEAAISKLDRKNNALLAAVYLLSADRALWNQTGKCVFKSGIAFESFKGSSCTPNGYTLLADITALMNSLISEPDRVQIEANQSETPLALRRLENEIGRMLDAADFDRKALVQNMLERASLKYASIDSKPYISKRLRADLEQSGLLPDFSMELFDRTVKGILLDADGNVSIRLINDQIIGKE